MHTRHYDTHTHMDFIGITFKVVERLLVEWFACQTLRVDIMSFNPLLKKSQWVVCDGLVRNVSSLGLVTDRHQLNIIYGNQRKVSD